MRKLVEKKSVKCCTDRRLVGLAIQNTRDKVVRMEGEVIKLFKTYHSPRPVKGLFSYSLPRTKVVGLPVGARVCLYKQQG